MKTENAGNTLRTGQKHELHSSPQTLSGLLNISIPSPMFSFLTEGFSCLLQTLTLPDHLMKSVESSIIAQLMLPHSPTPPPNLKQTFLINKRD